ASAILTATGAVNRTIGIAKSATLTFVGSVPSKTITVIKSGSLVVSGAIQSASSHGLNAILTTSGALRNAITHALSGVLTFTGSLVRGSGFFKSVSATLTVTGTSLGRGVIAIKSA